MKPRQLLNALPSLPAGLRYEPGLLSADEEQQLLERFPSLPFAPFEFQGYPLGSPCVFRPRRKTGANWQRASFTAEPRSGYLLAGAARSEWEHSIPPVDKLRYPIAFRNVRPARGL